MLLIMTIFKKNNREIISAILKKVDWIVHLNAANNKNALKLK